MAALAVNAAVSLSGLLLSVAVARQTSARSFGEFALAMTVSIFVIGIIHAAITDSALASESGNASRIANFQRAAVAGAVTGALVLGLGVLTGSFYLTVLGISLHGLVVLDYVRTLNSAVYSARNALLQGGLWSASVGIAACFSFVAPISAEVLFVIWAGTGAAAGYTFAWIGRYPLKARWVSKPGDNKTSLLFALEFSAGSGSAALATSLLGPTIGITAVGSLRAAGTLLGPVNLLTTTARSLAIPYLLRRRSLAPLVELRAALTTALAIAAVSVPLVAVVILIPPSVGRELLGASWDGASAVLLPIALDALMGAVVSIAISGHRAAGAGGRAIALRLVTGIPRPLVVVAIAIEFGVVGAAWSIAAVAAVNFVLWWASYVQLVWKKST